MNELPGTETKDEPVYYASEILQMIYGLMNVYWSMPWYIRWAYKPWFTALQTLALQVAGEQIIAEEDARSAVEYWEDKLKD